MYNKYLSKNYLTVATLILSWTQLFGQNINTYKPYWSVEVSTLKSMHKYHPLIFNRQGIGDGLRPPSLYDLSKTNERFYAIKYKPEFAVTAGMTKPLSNNALVRSNLGLKRIINNGEGVDSYIEIGPNWSEEDKTFNYSFWVVGLNIEYLQPFGFREKTTYRHRAGLGCQFDWVMLSHYNVRTANYSDVQEVMFYYKRDLNMKDRVTRVYPSIRYEYQLLSKHRRSCWLTSSYSMKARYIPNDFPEDDNFRPKTFFSYFSLGLRLDVQRKSDSQDTSS